VLNPVTLALALPSLALTAQLAPVFALGVRAIIEAYVSVHETDSATDLLRPLCRRTMVCGGAGARAAFRAVPPTSGASTVSHSTASSTALQRDRTET
jgi:hypothetical protein